MALISICNYDLAKNMICHKYGKNRHNLASSILETSVWPANGKIIKQHFAGILGKNAFTVITVLAGLDKIQTLRIGFFSIHKLEFEV